MRKTLFSGLLVLTLGACIDAELSLDFTDGDTVDGRFEYSMSRQLFDMTANTPEKACSQGQHSLTEEKFTCISGKTVSLDEFLAEESLFADGPNGNPGDAIRIEKLGDTRLRITMDFSDLGGDETDAQPEYMAGMADMMRAAVAGHSIVFTVKGRNIVETTGTLSEDGTTAQRVLPVAKFLDENPDFGPPFVTVVQLKETCRLWIFCS